MFSKVSSFLPCRANIRRNCSLHGILERRARYSGAGTRSYLNSLCNVVLSKQDAINYSSYMRTLFPPDPVDRRCRVTSLSSSLILPLSFQHPWAVIPRCIANSEIDNYARPLETYQINMAITNKWLNWWIATTTIWFREIRTLPRHVITCKLFELSLAYIINCNENTLARSVLNN